MKMDIVSKDVIPVPLIRIVTVKKRVSENVSVLGVLETVILVDKYSSLSRRGRDNVE